jgi:hypothetical protein
MPPKVLADEEAWIMIGNRLSHLSVQLQLFLANKFIIDLHHMRGKERQLPTISG